MAECRVGTVKSNHVNRYEWIRFCPKHYLMILFSDPGRGKVYLGSQKPEYRCKLYFPFSNFLNTQIYQVWTNPNWHSNFYSPSAFASHIYIRDLLYCKIKINFTLVVQKITNTIRVVDKKNFLRNYIFDREQTDKLKKDFGQNI